MSFVGKIATPNDQIIPASGFWPEIKISAFRESMRVLDFVNNSQCERELIKALLFVTDALTDFEEIQKSLGFNTLDEVPSKIIAGKSALIQRYEIALFSHAKASLLDVFRDIDITRKAGADKSDLIEPSIPALMADCMSAIREFLGKPAVRAVLL